MFDKKGRKNKTMITNNTNYKVSRMTSVLFSFGRSQNSKYLTLLNPFTMVLQVLGPAVAGHYAVCLKVTKCLFLLTEQPTKLVLN